jgi:hypothetical protein
MIVAFFMFIKEAVLNFIIPFVFRLSAAYIISFYLIFLASFLCPF